MSGNIIHTYFVGLTKQIQAELEYMNDIIKHMGEKGRANEKILRDMLIKFLPKKYHIGSGIIIDREGNSSKQCDVIIYDKEYHPDFFGQRSTVLYPVDVVYASIEVKTTLDQTEIKNAIENIISVKSLNLIPDPIPLSGSKSVGPTPPFGIIFGYDTDIMKAETIKSNFEKHLNGVNWRIQPDLGLILRKGIIMYHKPVKSPLKYFFSGKKTSNNNAEPTRAFLNFLALLYEILRSKIIRREAIFMDYLGEDYFENYEI